MSAAELRKAAETLRERAEAATEGPWEAWSGTSAGGGEYVTSRASGFGYTFGISPGIHGEAGWDVAARDAAYIATMHPGVGLALAKVLDTAADAIGHADLCMDCFHPTCLTVGELIPVARLINGGAA